MLPTLSRLSVSKGPGRRLRHRCSSQYLRISPLHWEFHAPLPISSPAVSSAIPRLSPGLSHSTSGAAYAPFTPSKSEQRSPPSYYRGCWHEVSRGFFCGYRHHRPRRKSFTTLRPSSLQSIGIERSPQVKPRNFTPDSMSRLRALYAQSFRATLAPFVLPRLLARS